MASPENSQHVSLAAAGASNWDWHCATNAVSDSRQSELYSLIHVVHGGLDGQIHQDDLSEALDALNRHLQGKEPNYDTAYRIRLARGWVWVGDRGKIVSRDSDGQPARVAGIVQDISKLKAVESDLELHACVFQNTADGIFITDRSLRIFEANKEFLKLVGLSHAEVLGTHLADHLIDQPEAQLKADIEQELLLSGRWGERLPIRSTGRARLTAEFTVSPVSQDASGSSRLVGVCTDVTESVQAEKELWRAANFDALTGLPNRALFNDLLNQACAGARNSGQAHALMFIDLDRFKQVNDALGHAAGDSLLCQVADRMRSTIRSSEDAGQPPHYARLGGDEFAAILTHIHGEQDAHRVAERLMRALTQPYEIDDQTVTVTPSIGIALCPQDGDQTETLLKNADTAMYFAKSAGRGVYRMFSNDMEQHSSDRVTLEAAIDYAIANREFANYYQPVLDFQSGNIIGVEALARWTHQDQFVPPDRFIPVAEDTGQILAIGEWALRQACQDLAALLDNGLVGEDFTMSVNLSPVQFKRPDIARTIHDIVVDSGILPTMIQLEITESAIIDPIQAAIDTMSELVAMGFRIAIDDFGVGYSSLSHLKKFPAATLKIDRSFVSEIDTSERDLGVIHGIVALAQALSLRITSEGVETQDQQTCLANAGCDNWQGWLFSPAIPIDRLIAKLQDAELARQSRATRAELRLAR